MIQLAEDVFAVKNDPDQLDVNQEVIERLKLIHPATVSEYDNGNGPVVWILLIPTTTALMDQFLQQQISEKDLFEQTQPHCRYEAIYLCSAMVLEEYRRKGMTKALTLKAIKEIRADHPIKSLFVWPFSAEGDLSSDSIARNANLTLFKRDVESGPV